MYMYLYICMYMYMYMYMYLYMYTSTCICAYVCVHIHMHKYMFTHTYSHIHVQMHKHVHIHIHRKHNSYEWVISHMNATWLIHIHKRHNSYEWVISYMNAAWLMHIHTRHNPYECYTYIYIQGITHMNESYPICMQHDSSKLCVPFSEQTTQFVNTNGNGLHACLTWLVPFFFHENDAVREYPLQRSTSGAFVEYALVTFMWLLPFVFLFTEKTTEFMNTMAVEHMSISCLQCKRVALSGSCFFFPFSQKKLHGSWYNCRGAHEHLLPKVKGWRLCDSMPFPSPFS